MTDKILKQKRLMQKAIEVLDSMQENERIFWKLDSAYLKELNEKQQNQYANIMSQLVKEVTEATGFELVEASYKSFENFT